ncbi:MAG: hypothetical protein ACOYMG_15550, partial [Candidatus Methylumidiphilus sp.]
GLPVDMPFPASPIGLFILAPTVFWFVYRTGQAWTRLSGEQVMFGEAGTGKASWRLSGSANWAIGNDKPCRTQASFARPLDGIDTHPLTVDRYNSMFIRFIA